MSYQSIDSVVLLRKIEALQSALYVTLASLSVLSPSIKDCVVENLDEHASTHHDPEVRKAHKELSDKIKTLKIVSN